MMNHFNKLSVLILFLLTVACDFENTSSQTPGSATSSQQAVQVSPNPTPTPSPTSTSNPDNALDVPQIMTRLELNGNFVTTDVSNNLLVTPFTPSYQDIGNVSNGNVYTSDPRGITFTITSIVIEGGTKDHNNIYYLNANGKIVIQNNYSALQAQYQNVPSGTLYFDIDNTDNGLYSPPFEVDRSFYPSSFPNTGSVVITNGCGIFRLYADEARTQLLKEFSNFITCNSLY